MDIESLDCSLTWKDTVWTAVQPYINQFEEELEKLRAEKDEKYQAYCKSEENKEKRDAAYDAYLLMSVLCSQKNMVKNVLT